MKFNTFILFILSLIPFSNSYAAAPVCCAAYYQGRDLNHVYIYYENGIGYTYSEKFVQQSKNKVITKIETNFNTCEQILYLGNRWDQSKGPYLNYSEVAIDYNIGSSHMFNGDLCVVNHYDWGTISTINHIGSYGQIFILKN